MNDESTAERVRDVLQTPLELTVWSDDDASGPSGASLAIGRSGQRLTFALANRSGEALGLRPLDGARAETAYHLRLSFRPGTLADPAAVRVEPDGGARWEIDPVSGASGRQVFHLRCLDPLKLSSAPGAAGLGFVLAGLEPRGDQGVVQTEFSLNFDNLEREDGSPLAGHLLGRLSVYERIEDRVATMEARSGPHAYDPRLAIKALSPNLSAFAEGGRLVTLELCNPTDEPLSMRAGEGCARVRLPDFGAGDLRSEIFALNPLVTRLQFVGASQDFVVGSDHRSIVPRHDFDWSPATRYRVMVFLDEPDPLASLPRQLLMEYENFGRDGTRAGDLVVAFDAHGMLPEALPDDGGFRVRLGALGRTESPLSVRYKKSGGAVVDVGNALYTRILAISDPIGRGQGGFEAKSDGAFVWADTGRVWKLKSEALEIGSPALVSGRIEASPEALEIDADRSLSIRSGGPVSLEAAGPVTIKGGGAADAATRMVVPLVVDEKHVWMRKAVAAEAYATKVLQAPPEGITLLHERYGDGHEFIVRLGIVHQRADPRPNLRHLMLPEFRASLALECELRLGEASLGTKKLTMGGDALTVVLQSPIPLP